MGVVASTGDAQPVAQAAVEEAKMAQGRQGFEEADDVVWRNLASPRYPGRNKTVRFSTTVPGILRKLHFLGQQDVFLVTSSRYSKTGVVTIDYGCKDKKKLAS